MSNTVKGSTEKCLKHFVSTPNAAKLQDLFAFMSVVDSTLKHWMHGKLPNGENLVRLRCYLALQGYSVDELQMLQPGVRETGHIIALRVTTLDEAVRQVGTGTPNDRDQVLRYLLGKRSANPERAAQYSAFADLHRDALQKASTSMLRFNQNTGASDMDAPKVLLGAAMLPQEASKMTTKEELIDGFALMVKGMLSFAEMLLSDDFTPEDRARLREKAGGDGVFHLSNRLNRLCGERARRNIPSN